MTAPTSLSYADHRFPADIISHAIWLYFRFPLPTPCGRDPPALAPNLGGPPLEEVLFLRDEMANLAWAIERTVESAAGQPLNRFETDLEKRRRRSACRLGRCRRPASDGRCPCPSGNCSSPP